MLHNEHNFYAFYQNKFDLKWYNIEMMLVGIWD